jgi:Fic family protein
MRQAPFPWDDADPAIRSKIADNLVTVRHAVLRSAKQRDPFSLQLVRDWHVQSLAGVPLGEPGLAGKFRGEGLAGSKLSTSRVRVGSFEGTNPQDIVTELSTLVTDVTTRLEALDSQYPPGVLLDHKGQEEVVDLCAMIHGEWIRIHPFANGNGSTARLLANWVAVRYGLPAFVMVKPRPDSMTGYPVAAEMSMRRNHRFLKRIFVQMLDEERRRLSSS